MKTLKHYLAVLFWFLVGLFIVCGPARASSGTFTGGSGLGLTWTTTPTNLQITGVWSSQYNGDQIIFFYPSYPSNGHDGGQAHSVGPQNTSTNYDITGTTSGSVQIVLYSTNGGTVSTYTTDLGSLSWFYNPDSQVCTQSLTAGSGSIKALHTATGDAHGAQAGNAYNIAITAGEGAATIDASTGHFSITAGPHGGTIQYKCWISAGNGFSQSNDSFGSVGVSSQDTVNINIGPNTGDNTIQYDLKQDGTVFATITRAGHSPAYTGTFIVPADGSGDVTMETTVLGVSLTGNSYVSDPAGQVKINPPQTLIKSNLDTPPSPGNTTDAFSPSHNDAPVDAPKPSSGKISVWSSGNSSDNPATQKDLLTNNIYREGVDKVDAQLQGLLDNMDKNSKEGHPQGSDYGESDTNGEMRSTQALTSAQGTATSFQQTVSDKLTDTFGALPAINPVIVHEPSDDVITIERQHGIIMHTNPFSSAGPFGGVIGDCASFIRALISWGIVLAFYIWALKEVNTAAEGFFKAVPFSKSIEDSINSVKLGGFGGGLGYVARTAGLLLLVPFVLTLPLAIMAAATDHLPMTAILSAMTTGSPATPGGMLGEAVGLADRVVPWALLMSAPVWYVIAQYGLIPSKFFWMMFAKFIPL